MRTEHETLMTIDFWRSMGRGTLILKYPPVSGETDSQRRAVNGLIVLDGEFMQCALTNAPELAGRPAMIVQTKSGPTDSVLVGQAVFAPILLRRQHPAIGPVQSVLLSTEPEPTLSDLLQRHGVLEVTVPGPQIKSSRRSYPRVAESNLDDVHRRIGGEMLLGVQLGAEQSRRPVLKVDGVILPDRPWKRTRTAVDQQAQHLIPGAYAIAVVSTRGHLGMGSAGLALVAQHLLRVAGASDARAIALVGKGDRAVQFALWSFPGLTAEIISVDT
jgi:hypothetical protein